MKGKYFLSDYLIHKNIKLEKGVINLINAPAGSGKTTFVFNNLVNETYKYIKFNSGDNNIKDINFKNDLNKVLYICDTKMLKDKTLNKYENTTMILKENFFNDIENDEYLINNLKSNRIIVMTYKQLGWCLSIDYMKDFISSNIKLIIMDEFHNLFYYNNKFNSDKDSSYQNIIDNLGELVENNLFIGLTATPYYADKEITTEKYKSLNSIYKPILNNDDIKEIRQYENKLLNKILNPVNEIKWLCLHHGDIIKTKNKILIYSEKIITCNKYKKLLSNAGYKVETLFTEKKLNKEQKLLKKYLIENEKYPDELDIIIVNKAYECGWDIKDNRVQIIIIDSCNPTVITQVRNRCRFDIEKLVCTMKEVKKVPEPYKTEDGYYRRYIEISNNGQTYHNYISDNFNIDFVLDEKYIGYKILENKKEIIDKYGSYDERKQCNWATFKKDLVRNGYYIKQINKSTYIFKRGYPEIIKDSKEAVKKEKNKKDKTEVKNYLNKIINKKLIKEEQKELIDKVNIRVNGKQQKSYKKINEGLKNLNLNYVIMPKKSNNTRYWIVKKISI